MQSNDWALSVGFNPKDDAQLAAGVGNNVIIWDTSNRQVINKLTQEHDTFMLLGDAQLLL